MPTAIIDTNVIVAVQSERDQYHDTAQRIIAGMDSGDLPLGRITNYVLAESLNLIGERFSHRAATGMLDRLIESAGFEIVHTTKSDFNAGQALFRRYEGLTFVDAITAAHAGRMGIEYLYSFDDDFDAVEGVSRLNSAVDPFA